MLHGLRHIIKIGFGSAVNGGVLPVGKAVGEAVNFETLAGRSSQLRSLIRPLTHSSLHPGE